MSEEYIITVHDMIDLWDCLASLRIGETDISLLSIYQRDTIRNKFDFVVKGGKNRHVYADYDTMCLISLKDYTQEIGIFVKRQARIEAFITLHKSMTNITNILAKARLAWELEQRSVELSLDTTQPINNSEDFEEE